MLSFNELMNQTGLLIRQVVAGNELWRFMTCLAILVFGFTLLEIVFRIAGRRIQKVIEQKAIPPESCKLINFLPPLRLAVSALLLWVSEIVLVLPGQLVRLLNGLEGLLLALAAILLLFQLISMLDQLRFALPPQLQEEFPEKTLNRLKGVLRIAVLVGVAGSFIYSQKTFFPEWLWQYAVWRYFFVLTVIAAILFVMRLIDRFLAGLMANLRSAEEKMRQLLITRSAVWPIRLLLITIALYAFKEILPLPAAINRLVEGAMGLLTTLAVIIFLYRLLDLAVHELGKVAQKEENLFDQSLVHMTRIIVRALLLVVGAIYIVRAISGKPLSALLAGLGIGGLALALAAQDTLKNFFGSIMIMLDKPFNVGQRVLVDNYDGVVEDIGFRSTRIRTLTGNLVTVPNDKMATAGIENVGHRPSIRRLTNISLTYDTPPEKVQRALTIIREVLDNHEGMHPDFPPRVYFTEFNPDSLNILMLYWYFPPDYWRYCEFTEKVNLQIMQAFEEERIEFAFPTTTTYLAQDNRRPLQIRVSGESRFSKEKQKSRDFEESDHGVPEQN